MASEITVSFGLENQRPDKKVVGGAYEGVDRLNRETALWRASLRSADAEVIPAKDQSDARTRDLERNDGYFSGARQTYKDSVVGGVYRLNSRPDWRLLGLDETWAEEFQTYVERKFLLWAESPACYPDAARRNTFTGLLRLDLGQHFSGGESLSSVEWKRNSTSPYKTCFQIIDTDRLSNPHFGMDTPLLRKGVEMDRFGAPIALHIRNGHPYDNILGLPDSFSWKRVPMEKPWGRPQMIFIAETMRPSQTRAVSQLVSILSSHRMLKKYKQIALQRAVVDATYAASIESELPAGVIAQQLSGDDSDPAMKWIREYLGAQAEFQGASKALSIDGVRIPTLFPGTKLNLRGVGAPVGVGSEFEVSLERHIARAFGMSREEFIGDFSKTNYSSLRAATAKTDMYMSAQKKLIADRIATSRFRCWLEEEFSKEDSDLPLPRNAPNFWDDMNAWAYASCQWIGSSRGQIDQMKETQAAILRIANGISTFEKECALLGEDFREVFEQRAREKRLLEEYDLDDVLSAIKPGNPKNMSSSSSAPTDEDDTQEEE